jgi:hypothetical protein
MNSVTIPMRGYHFLHTVIDGHSRLAYNELLSGQYSCGVTDVDRRHALASLSECASSATVEVCQ